MTNENLTHIGMIIDRSGSMYSIKDDTEGGIRSFVADQKTVPGETQFSLAQFDTEYELVYDSVDLDSVKYQLHPRGATAFLDALGKFVTHLGDKFSDQSEEVRPGKVIVVIMTDGMENASKEWTLHNVKKLIKQQTEDWNWEFIFMGANMDAVAEGSRFGFSAGNSISYAASGVGTQNVYASTGDLVRGMRTNSSRTQFTDEDRNAAMEDDNK